MDLVKQLVQQKVSPVGYRDGDGWNSLHKASRSDRRNEILKILVKFATPEEIDSVDIYVGFFFSSFAILFVAF